MPSLGGLSQGSAPNSAASSTARGEKYAVTRFALRSCLANTAMLDGCPEAANNGGNSRWILSDGADAATPSPSVLRYQVSTAYPRLRVGSFSTLLFSGSSASVATAGAIFCTPAFSRILPSISFASAALSLRKSRALSLPWPRRSPL